MADPGTVASGPAEGQHPAGRVTEQTSSERPHGMVSLVTAAILIPLDPADGGLLPPLSVVNPRWSLDFGCNASTERETNSRGQYNIIPNPCKARSRSVFTK